MPKICPKIYPRSILWYIGEPVNNYFSVNVVFFLLRGGIQLKNRYFRSITIFLAFFHTILALVCLRDGLFGPLLIVFKTNIAKGTTDPRFEFISQDHSSQFKNLEHITISESRLSINVKILTKHQHLD